MTNHSTMQPTVDMSTQKTKQGFTLTEIAIVLGIVGLILGAVWSAAKNVYSNANSTKATQITSVLIANVRGLYANSAPTSGDLSPAFSNFSYNDGSTTYNPAVTATNLTGGPITVSGFTISMDSAVTSTVNGVTYGTALGVASTDTAICNGVVSAATEVSGANIGQTQAASIAATSQACTVAGPCPTKSGFIPNGTCATATSTCYYTPVGVCNPGATNTKISVFIPWNS